MNRTRARADALAGEYKVPHVFTSLDEMIAAAPEDVIFDLALQASLFADSLRKLPDGAYVLIQKPMGEPRSMMARSVPHPDLPKLTSVSSSIILDYPDPVRASISTNHCHHFGPKHQESYLKWEGTKGAIKVRIGLLMDYSRGVCDEFEYCLLQDGSEPEWQKVEVEGSWFPEAFIGTMAQMMCAKEGSAPDMPTSVEDVIKTMACVEAAYESNSVGGVKAERYEH